MTIANDVLERYKTDIDFHVHVLLDPERAIRAELHREPTTEEKEYFTERQRAYALTLLWRYNPEVQATIRDAESAKDFAKRLGVQLEPDEVAYLDSRYPANSPGTSDALQQALYHPPLPATWHLFTLSDASLPPFIDPAQEFVRGQVAQRATPRQPL